jgi:hypothetical protein
MKKLILLASVAASPAMAASGPFFSLGNTNFVVTVSFILFIGVLLKFGVPGMLTGMLDKRAEQIKADRVDEVGPARKVLVQADAVDGAERRGDLVEADQDLELGLEANLSQDTVVWFDCGCVCVCKGACEPATRR